MSERANKALYIALSLLIAVVFWLYVDDVQGSAITETYYRVPIEFIGAEDTLPSRGLMLSEGEDITIDLKLSGPRILISGLDKDDIRIQVNLSNISAVGTYTLNYQLLYPDDVDSTKITRDWASRTMVTVEVVELYTKMIPVEVSATGEVAENYIYMAERLVLDPVTLTVSGREEDVDQVASARINLDLTGVSSSISRKFDYDLLDADGNVVEVEGIRVSDNQVQVDAPIYLIKTLDLTVKFKESPGSMLEDVEWKLEQNTIEVAGDAASLENKEDILLGEIDLASLLSDTEMVLDISLPAGTVNISGFTTTTLTISFSDDLATKALSVSNISAVGLSEGQSFDRLTNSVEVVLRGPADILDQVTAEDVRIVVDLEEYTSNGTYSVPAQVLVDGYDNVGAVGSCSVACKIRS